MAERDRDREKNGGNLEERETDGRVGRKEREDGK